MKGLKYHLAMILPLFLVLFCVEFSVILDRIVRDYEAKMSRDYNIIVVSRELLSPEVLRDIPAYESLAQIDTKRASERLKSELSAANYERLLASLPHFYTIRLSAFPAPAQMDAIRAKLLEISGVTRVETFSDTHDKVYKILQLLSYFFVAFVVVVGLLVVLLLLRQIQLWLFKNRQKMEVMRLCGASYIYRSLGLYIGAVVYSAVSAALVCGVYAAFVRSAAAAEIFASLGFSASVIFRLRDSVMLFGVAGGLCVFAVVAMMAKAK